MPMMGSRRGMQPDQIPPIFYILMFLPVLICALALLINFFHRSQDQKDRGVVDAYEKIVQSRVKGRTRYISDYLDKKNKEDEEK